jgi:tetratricopeptide (TPR) repeat protein
MLAVQPGQLVSVDELVDELWPDCPPRSAVANVRTYAANLRRGFEALQSGCGAIVRQRNGYRLRSSLVLFQRTGHRYGEAEARNTLGVAYRGLHDLDLARLQHEAALKVAADSGERHVQCAALNDLGYTLLALRDADSALETFQQGLQLAGRISNPYEQGRALAGLAEHLAGVDPAEARRHWERALAIFRRMGVPERLDVERRLAETDRETGRRPVRTVLIDFLSPGSVTCATYRRTGEVLPLGRTGSSRHARRQVSPQRPWRRVRPGRGGGPVDTPSHPAKYCAVAPSERPSVATHRAPERRNAPSGPSGVTHRAPQRRTAPIGSRP